VEHLVGSVPIKLLFDEDSIRDGDTAAVALRERRLQRNGDHRRGRRSPGRPEHGDLRH
jgi:hypothetical protein